MQVESDEAPFTYSWPSKGSQEFTDFFHDSSASSQTKNTLSFLPGGRVFGSGNVLSPDGQSIARDVSLDFGKPFTEHWLLQYPKLPPPTHQPGVTAITATTLGSGYSHWLLEELPRLIRIQDQSFDQVITHTGKEYHRKALALLGYSGKTLPARRHSHTSCDTLLIPSMTGQAGYPTPSLVRLIQEFTFPLHKNNSTNREKVYLSRARAKRRRVTNESVLISALESKGFHSVLVEELSWQEQINLFQQAKVIVSPHGAALAGLIFCRPGTQVLEFFNRAYLNPCYWRLASVLSLDYHPLFPSTAEPLSDKTGHNRLDIEADIGPILAAITDF
jgi:capsular polysaccharide biosynthesis protein